MDKLSFSLILCFAVTIRNVASEMFYIVTSSDSPCPGIVIGEPCLTLQQYASNPSLSSNVTLELESGNHNLLDSTLEVLNIASFKIIANEATIRCSENSGYIRINSVQEVYISGITFVDCGSSTQGAKNFILKDSNILNSTFSVRSTTNAVFTRCSFSFRGQYGLFFDSTSTLVEMCTFSDIVVHGRPGGGIWTRGPNSIRVTQSTFTKINGISGALYVESDGNTVTLENSTFAMNRIKSDYFKEGGVVYQGSGLLTIDGCSFVNNCVSGDGGAVSGVSVNVSIFESSFDNNTAGGSGGAVYAVTDRWSSRPPSSVAIHRSSFIRNIANESGGALYVSGSMVSISQSTFTNNTATIGGGGVLYSARHSTDISFVESIFTYNSTAYCGVLEADEQYNNTVSFTASTFTHNKATGQVSGRSEGGIVCVRNASISIQNGTFNHNTAVGDAGVGVVDESTVTIHESTFNNNTAGHNGGVFRTQIYPSTYIVNQSSFTNNQAGGNGGVMYVGRAGSQVSVSGSTFGFNSATVRGGVIVILGSQLEFAETSFYNNTAYWGGVLSACNSHIIIPNAELYTGTDPINSQCTLYYDSNTTIPQDYISQDMITTETGDIHATSEATLTITTTTDMIETITTTVTRSTIADTPLTDVTTTTPLDMNGQQSEGSTTAATTTQGANGMIKISADDQDLYHALTIASLSVSVTLCILVVVLYVILVCKLFKSKTNTKSALRSPSCHSSENEYTFSIKSDTAQLKFSSVGEKETIP